MTNLLEVRNLTRSFGGLIAVNDVSFSLRGGRITALIGPNGAGKTTCFNLVAGALRTTSGQVFFEGGPSRTDVRKTCAEWESRERSRLCVRCAI